MPRLKGFQRKYLRGLAHRLKPVVQIGQAGLSDGAMGEIDDALDRHELIKVKLNEIKDRTEKQALAERVEAGTGGELVGMIGHTCIFYRRHPDEEKRSIRVPLRETNKS